MLITLILQVNGSRKHSNLQKQQVQETFFNALSKSKAINTIDKTLIDDIMKDITYVLLYNIRDFPRKNRFKLKKTPPPRNLHLWKIIIIICSRHNIAKILLKLV